MGKTVSGSCPVTDFFMCDEGPFAYINRVSDGEWTKLAQVLAQMSRIFVIAGFSDYPTKELSRHVSGSYWLRMTSNAWIFLISAINFQITLTGSQFQVRS